MTAPIIAIISRVLWVIVILVTCLVIDQIAPLVWLFLYLVTFIEYSERIVTHTTGNRTTSALMVTGKILSTTTSLTFIIFLGLYVWNKYYV